MGSMEQSTGVWGSGDLTPRGGGRGGRRGRGGGEVRARGHSNKSGDQSYEKRSYRNHGQQHNYGGENKINNNNNKDRPTNMMMGTATDAYQSTASPDLEFDDEQIALNEQMQVLRVQKESSGKKISLNHLLRFTLPQREAPQPVRRTRRTTSTPFKKETFLHANYRFIVSGEGGDYKDNVTDPDKAVPWEYVEQVYYHTDLDAEYHCPICLDKPVAAKVSRCGHVFCWACIMHHLSYTKGAGQCPLCFDWMLIKDLKSVVIEVTPKLSLNDDVSLCLLQRSADANIPRLKSTAAQDAAMGLSDESSQRLPVYTDAGAEFCRLTVAYDIAAILAREWSELAEAARLAASAQDDSLPYLTHAQEALRDRADKAHIPFALVTNRPSRGSRHKANAATTPNKAIVNANQNTDDHDYVSNNNNNAPPTKSNANPSNTVYSKPPHNSTPITPTPSTTISTPSTITPTPSTITPTPSTTPPTPIFTTSTPPTSIPTKNTTNNEHNNNDMWGWEEDENETTSSSSTTSTPLSQSPASMPPPTSSSSSSSSSVAQSQVAFLHSSFDQSHIPPSVLFTTPPKAEDVDSPPVTTAHHSREEFTQETSHGYYFYQVQDGHTVFLHPFCVRVLAYEHRAFNHLPPALHGTIMDFEEVVQTEKTRKKFQHLSHLPITCKFLLVYIDLTALVSGRTLAYFAEDLKKIKQNRERRMQVERKRQGEKEREEREDRERVQERRRERQAEMDLMHESFAPLSISPSALPPSSALPTAGSEGTESEDKEEEREREEERRQDEDEEDGISFAQALMGAKPRPRRRPKPKANNNNNNNSSNSNSNNNNSGESKDNNGGTGEGGGEGAGGKKSKKKKKKQTVLLFSNSGFRGNY